MRFCGTCGAKLTEAALACPNCGAPAPEQPEMTETVTEEQPETAETVTEKQPETAETVTEKQPETVEAATEEQPETAGTVTEKQPETVKIATEEQPEITDAAILQATGGRPEPGRKKGVRKSLAILLGVLILAVVAAGLFAAGVFTPPDRQFIRLQNAFLTEPLAKGMSALADRGNATVGAFADTLTLTGTYTASETDKADAAIAKTLSELSLVMRARTDSAAAEQETAIDVMLQGDLLLRATLTRDGDRYGLYMPTIDDTYYVCALPEFLQNHPELASAEYAALLADPADMYGGLTQESADAIARRYLGLLLSVAHRGNVTKTKESLSLCDGRETVSCQVYTLTPTEADYLDLLPAIGEALEDDEALYEFAFALYRNQSIADPAYNEAATEADFNAAWADFVWEFTDNAVENAKTLAEREISWSVAAKGARVHMQSIRFTDDTGTAYRIAYESAGATLSDRSDHLIVDAGEGDGLALKSHYMRSGKSLAGSLDYIFTASHRETAQKLTYTLDLATKSGLSVPYGTYTLASGGADARVTASLTVGAAEDGGSDHRLLVAADGYDVELNLHSADQAPEGSLLPAVEPVDVTDWTQEELDAVTSGWKEGLQGVLMRIVLNAMGM